MAESHRGVTVAPRERTEGTSPDVSALVYAFEDVVQTTYGLPPVVMVPATHRRRGYRRYVHSLPRPRWLLRFFVVDHARMTLDVVHRRLLATAALGRETDETGKDREAVKYYLDGLPTQRRPLYSTSLAVLTVVLTSFVLLSIPDAIERFGGTGMARNVDEINALLSTLRIIGADVTSLDAFFDAVRRAPLETVAFVLTSLLTVLYVELRPFVPAFRLKRAMFNRYPRPQDVSSTPAPWSVQRATGLYDLERSVVRDVGAPPRREVPFDLIVPALLMPSLLYLGWLLVQNGLFTLPLGERLLNYLFGVALIAGALVRLGWLTRAWLRRTRAYAGPYLPAEVRIHGTRLVVALRDPHSILATTGVLGALCVGISIVGVRDFGSSILTLFGMRPTTFDAARFLLLGFVIAPVWYRINRDVSAYLKVRGASRTGRPWLSLLAMATGWLGTFDRSFLAVVAVAAICWVLVSVYNTGRRVQRAEATAMAEPTLLPPALLAAGFVAFPFVLRHIQRALNAAWRADGDLLD